MPQVIQIRRRNPYDEAGQGFQNMVDTLIRGTLAMNQQQDSQARSMASLGMMGTQMRRQDREDARMAQKEAARAKVAEALGGLDMNSPGFGKAALPLIADAPDIMTPLLNSWNSQRNTDRMIAAQNAAAARQDAMMNKPQYDSRLGGFVRPDGAFQPLQMPDGYTPPPQQPPQKSYKDMAFEGAAQVSTIPEEQRTPEQKQVVALAQMYGWKPQASGELEVLPLDTSARKEAFELRNQWDEAERVQRAFDEFEKTGGQGGTGLLLGMLPSTIQNRVDPEGTPLRGAISQMSSVIMNALSGAAVSEQERKRLEGFLPTASDDLPTIRKKLSGYRDYISTKTDSWRKMYGGVKPLDGIQRDGAPSQSATSGGNVIRYDEQGRRLQ